VTERQPADLGRGGNVSFDQRPRNLQAAYDVVEAVAGIVSWQKRRGVAIEREQVVDRIGAFGSVGAVHAPHRQSGLRGSGAVEFILERHRESFVGGRR